MNRSAKRQLLLSALMTLMCSVVAGTVRADTATFGCGTPANGGEVTLRINYVNASGASLGSTVGTATIPSGASATAKCAALLSALQATSGSGGLSLSGTVLTATDFSTVLGGPVTIVKSIEVVNDFTREQSGLTIFLDSDQQLQLGQIAVFSATDCSLPNHLMCVAPVGETFSGAVSASGHTPFTFSAVGNGTSTYGSLLAEIDGEISAGLGIPDFCTDPTNTTMCAPLSSPFDPDTVTISWDGNTGFDLANFGLQVVSAPTPESGTLMLSGGGLIGLVGALRTLLAGRS